MKFKLDGKGGWEVRDGEEEETREEEEEEDSDVEVLETRKGGLSRDDNLNDVLRVANFLFPSDEAMGACMMSLPRAYVYAHPKTFGGRTKLLGST
eukprot:53434-Eustigmatos_ZCMA.PRE.2